MNIGTLLSPIQLEIGLKHLEVKTFLKFESLQV